MKISLELPKALVLWLPKAHSLAAKAQVRALMDSCSVLLPSGLNSLERSVKHLKQFTGNESLDNDTCEDLPRALWRPDNTSESQDTLHGLLSYAAVYSSASGRDPDLIAGRSSPCTGLDDLIA